eukprot:540018-Prorocentrum_minimum.AAC.3
MLTTLANTFRALREDKTVRAVVLTGAGGQAFTAGVDLTAAQQVFKTNEKDFEKDVVHQMDLCSFPIIGAVNGWAINAGFELALACDMLFASPAATFVDTHIKFGLQPAWGLSQVNANRATFSARNCVLRIASFHSLPFDDHSPTGRLPLVVLLRAHSTVRIARSCPPDVTTGVSFGQPQPNRRIRNEKGEHVAMVGAAAPAHDRCQPRQRGLLRRCASAGGTSMPVGARQPSCQTRGR